MCKDGLIANFIIRPVSGCGTQVLVFPMEQKALEPRQVWVSISFTDPGIRNERLVRSKESGGRGDDEGSMVFPRLGLKISLRGGSRDQILLDCHKCSKPDFARRMGLVSVFWNCYQNLLASLLLPVVATSVPTLEKTLI